MQKIVFEKYLVSCFRINIIYLTETYPLEMVVELFLLEALQTNASKGSVKFESKLDPELNKTNAKILNN